MSFWSIFKLILDFVLVIILFVVTSAFYLTYSLWDNPIPNASAFISETIAGEIKNISKTEGLINIELINSKNKVTNLSLANLDPNNIIKINSSSSSNKLINELAHTKINFNELLNQNLNLYPVSLVTLNTLETELKQAERVIIQYIKPFEGNSAYKISKLIIIQ